MFGSIIGGCASVREELFPDPVPILRTPALASSLSTIGGGIHILGHLCS